MVPTQFYVDLTSFQNATKLQKTNYQYNKLIDAMMCVSNKRMAIKKSQGCRKHNRFKPSEYVSTPKPYIKQTQNVNNVKHKSSKKFQKNVDMDQRNILRKKVVAPQVTSLNLSPHYLRHKNRQENQARAMEQVVRWLEQEFSTNFCTENHAKQNHDKPGNFKKQNTKMPSTANVNVERHEHHHMHEHIHHHYHHYQETPIVV